MNLFSDIRALVIGSLEAMVGEGALPAGLDFSAVAVEPPRDAAHGDMATNAAMVLAKAAGANPRAIAETLAVKLAADPRVVLAEVAGPGFLNLRLQPAAWQGVVRAALGAGRDYGRSAIGRGVKVNVEFVSANPTGPMHVGHVRGAVFGDALASLLAFAGHEVTREYYINDGGAQVDVLARSAYERYREAHGLEPEIREGLYPGDYLIPVGEALKETFGTSLLDKPEADWLARVREFATERMMAMIREDLATLGVRMDVYSSEKALYGTGKIEAAIETLRGMGLVYEGVLEPPKGKVPEDWEEREQTLFRSTAHGDDVDRPVMKSDGSWTYFAPDIAYHYNKVRPRLRPADRHPSVPITWRLCQTDEGRRVGPVQRKGAARHQADSAGQALQERRTLQDVEARGDLRDPARCGRTGGRGCDALRDADAQKRRGAGFRLRQGAGTVQGQSRLLCPIRAMRGSEFRAAPRGARPGIACG